MHCARLLITTNDDDDFEMIEEENVFSCFSIQQKIQEIPGTVLYIMKKIKMCKLIFVSWQNSSTAAHSSPGPAGPAGPARAENNVENLNVLAK